MIHILQIIILITLLSCELFGNTLRRSEAASLAQQEVVGLEKPQSDSNSNREKAPILQDLIVNSSLIIPYRLYYFISLSYAPPLKSILEKVGIPSTRAPPLVSRQK